MVIFGVWKCQNKCESCHDGWNKIFFTFVREVNKRICHTHAFHARYDFVKYNLVHMYFLHSVHLYLTYFLMAFEWMLLKSSTCDVTQYSMFEISSKKVIKK